VLATLIDTASGFAGCYCAVPGNRRRAMTLSLDTHFIGRAKPDGRLTATARQVGGGRNVFFAAAEVRDETGALIATGGGVFRYRGSSGDPHGEPADGSHPAGIAGDVG
jgi:acyl-coenzyme A thioesterase PaaI-like protein